MVRPKWFLRLWYIWRNPCTYLALKLTLSPNGSKRSSIWASSPILRPKWCKLWTYLAPRLTLSPNGPKQFSTWPTSPRSSIGCVQNDFRAYGTFVAKCAPILNRDYHCIQTDRNELPFEPRHLGVTSGASKMISEAIEHLVQTVHLSYTETNTARNGPKWASIWALSPRSTTRCIQNHFLAFGTYGANHAPIMHRVPPKWFSSLWYVRCKPCNYLESRFAQYPNGPKRASIWASSSRSTIWCVQNDFWGYGIFGAIRAPILHWN
jgi:hypothetical protein